MRWPWQPKAPDPKPVGFGVLSEIPLEWEKVEAVPPQDNSIGICVYCRVSIMRMEEHFELVRVGGIEGWGAVVCCQKCAVEKGLKW